MAQEEIALRSLAGFRNQIPRLFHSSLAVSFLFTLASVATSRAVTDNAATDEFRQSISTHHEIWQDLTGYGQFEYRDNPQEHYQTYVVTWPGVIYSVKPWLQLSGGLSTLQTENVDKANTLELRPFGGFKIFLPNHFKWYIYNYSRFEFRDTQNQDTYQWSSYSRVRSQFGVNIPLASRANAWQPNTFYATAFVEPIYRFDTDQVNPVYFSAGLGYIINHRLRVEFTYYDELTRPTTDSSLQQTYNIFELNLKIDLGRGILERLNNPE